MFKNNFGSTIAEKILIVITSVILFSVGISFINKIVNNSIEHFSGNKIEQVSPELDIRPPSKNLLSLRKELYTVSTSAGNAWELYLELKPNTTYTMSSNTLKEANGQTRLWFGGGSTWTNGVWEGQTRTLTTDNTGKVKMFIDKNTYLEVCKEKYWIMLNEGNKPLPFEHYQK